MISTSTNAEKQKHYRKQKKLERDTFLEKEKKTKSIYVKTPRVTKKELKDQGLAVKERIQQSGVQKKSIN